MYGLLVLENSRGKPEEESANEAREYASQENTLVDFHVLEPGEGGAQRQKRTDPQGREDHSHQAAGQTQHQAFRKELLSDAPPTGSHGHPSGDLPPPVDGFPQKQGSHVSAGDEKEKPGGAHEEKDGRSVPGNHLLPGWGEAEIGLFMPGVVPQDGRDLSQGLFMRNPL